MSSIIPYELYLVIQSILKKNTVQVAINPTVYLPYGWVASYATFLAQRKGVITTPISLPKTASYTFQVAYTVEPTPGYTYNAHSLEVRLYYGPFNTPINPSTSPFYGLATIQLDDQNHRGVFDQTCMCVIPNVIAPPSISGGAVPQQFQLGYWVGSVGTIGSNANIQLTIQYCFFTEYTGFQTITTSPIRIFPALAIPVPPPSTSPPTDNLVRSESLVYSDNFLTFSWKSGWNTQPNPLRYIGFGIDGANFSTTILVYDGDGTLLQTYQTGTVTASGRPVSVYYYSPLLTTASNWSVRLYWNSSNGPIGPIVVAGFY